MKLIGTFLLAFIVLGAVAVSGCVQQQDTAPTGGEELTQAEMEDQAYRAVEQEMEQAIDDMTLEEIENELLAQG